MRASIGRADAGRRSALVRMRHTNALSYRAVKIMLAMHEEGFNFSQIARELEEQELTTAKGRAFTPQNVRNYILARR